MTTKKRMEEIDSCAKELIAKIRALAESQRDIWQQIPYYALHADGRTGYSDKCLRAYELGYWAIGSNVRRGHFTVFVDLETGRLVNARKPRKEAFDVHVIEIAKYVEQLDAKTILNELKSHTRKRFDKHYNEHDRKERATRIRNILSKGLITPTSFKRDKTPEEVANEGSDSWFQ